jgi:hypothetical protein
MPVDVLLAPGRRRCRAAGAWGSFLASGVDLAGCPSVLAATVPTVEEAIKCMLLTIGGDTPTPRDPEAWARKSEDERHAVLPGYSSDGCNDGRPECDAFVDRPELDAAAS